MNDDFVYVDECLPGVRWDAKYATWDNFTGKPVDGYLANRIVGTRALGAALKKLPPGIADQIRLVFVTTDPARDSPTVLRRWLDLFDRRRILQPGRPPVPQRRYPDLRHFEAWARALRSGSD